MSFESDSYSASSYNQKYSPSDFDLLQHEMQNLNIDFPPSLRLKPTDDPEHIYDDFCLEEPLV